jgi:formylglycine-generating enzyme required for sulfatase activity
LSVIFSGFRYVALIGIGLSVLSCTHKKFPLETSAPESFSFMTPVFSKDRNCLLGSDASIAKADEKPSMPVSFTYDFWIDTYEVTIGMYRSMMGRLPAEYDSIAEVGDQFPVAYVSWFDAVLFCNARSRKEGFDTVYSYIGKDTTATGSVYQLRGVRTNLSAWGYRLPTEAEWVYAALGGTQGPYPWGGDSAADSVNRGCWWEGNALQKAHEEGQKKPNGFGLYDMAGNVMEWVNDVKTAFSKEAFADFAGGADNSVDERIVKGGSFVSASQFLRVSARSDAYATASAARTRYIGFRCAGGSIAKPSYKTPSGAVKEVAPFYLSISSLSSATGSSRAKVVFVNVSSQTKRTLCCVDFTRNGVNQHQFFDDSTVYTPMISPNGSWVAYCSRSDDGGSGPARVSVRSLSDWSSQERISFPDIYAYVPRWWVDPVKKDTFIVYTTSTVGNTLSDWRLSQTKMRKFANGAVDGNAIVVEAAGSYHGGLSRSGRYIGTGSPLLRFKDRQTGIERFFLLARRLAQILVKVRGILRRYAMFPCRQTRLRRVECYFWISALAAG